MKCRSIKRVADRSWHRRFIVRDIIRIVGGANPFPIAETQGRYEWTQRGNFTRRRT